MVGLFALPKRKRYYLAKLKNHRKKTTDLIPYENNPRHNDEAVEYVKNSIKQFGFKVPIILDKDNVIIAGHTRLKAAKELGLETVPCIMADDLTPEQVKAFRLADNKVSEQSGWDFRKLEEELEAVSFDINMEEFGFVSHNDDQLSDDDFFQESESKEHKPRTVTCPRCGKTFEL